MSKFNLTEGLGYKDLAGMLKNTIYIDDFSSKMGDDDEIVVASFYVRDRQAAVDLVNWFEKGYDFVLDADMSPGEVKPNRYLVYIELKRRNYTADNLASLLDDFSRGMSEPFNDRKRRGRTSPRKSREPHVYIRELSGRP